MNYIYRNITGDNENVIIPSDPSKIITVSKCHIANTHTSNINVDIYIQDINERLTQLKYGDSENNPDRELVQQIYYKIKGLDIPAGTAFELFVDSKCIYEGRFKFVVKLNNTSETADVFVDYEVRDSGTGSSNRRNITQY